MTQKSIPWHVVKAKAAERIEDIRTQLETAPPEMIARLQGEIAGVRFITDLPLRLTDPDNMVGDRPLD